MMWKIHPLMSYSCSTSDRPKNMNEPQKRTTNKVYKQNKLSVSQYVALHSFSIGFAIAI